MFAIRLWLAGVDVGKHGLSNKKEAQNIFVENVGRAWELATGLRATRWRYRYKGDGPDVDAPESPLFRLARELGDAFGRPLPKDLKLAGQRASRIRYGAMSPALKVEQDALLLAAGRQRPGELSVRLKAYVAQGGARAVPKPETVWGALPLELRLLALGLSSANNFDGSSALAGALFDR